MASAAEPDVVAIALSSRAVSSVEWSAFVVGRCDELESSHRHIVGQEVTECALHLVSPHGAHPLRKRERDNLAGGVYACVGTACPPAVDGRPKELEERGVHIALGRAHVRLDLPSMERAAVVGELEPYNHRAALSTRTRTRRYNGCRSGEGSWTPQSRRSRCAEFPRRGTSL